MLIFLSVSACKKEDEQESSPGSDLWGQSMSASAYGIVLDENNMPVEGATVKAGSKTTTTDAQGVFRINGFSAYKNLGYVKVEKVGYFLGSRSFVPLSGGNRLSIRLLSNSSDGSINAISGGTVSDLGSDVSVALSANSIVKNNSPYTGTVRVAIRNITTQSNYFSEEMPGNLIGAQDNQSLGLVSYGMLAAELTDNNGEVLQLASGQKATVRLPIAPQQLGSAPSSIDLWSFDEQNGYWKHEGVATKQNNEYVAQVSHFSFWNCDIPLDWITIEGTITDAGGQPLQGATVTLNSQTNGTASDITNAQGQFSGWVPAGQTFIMTVQLPSCTGNDTTVYTQSIGPFSVNTTLDPIAVNLPGTIQVTGVIVDCNNIAQSSGYVLVNGEVYFTNYSGQFSFSRNCIAGSTLYPFIASPYTVGTPVQIPNDGNLGNISVCNPGGGGGGNGNGVANFLGIQYSGIASCDDEDTNLPGIQFLNQIITMDGVFGVYVQTTSDGTYTLGPPDSNYYNYASVLLPSVPSSYVSLSGTVTLSGNTVQVTANMILADQVTEPNPQTFPLTFSITCQ
jgi:hypothetical protein